MNHSIAFNCRSIPDMGIITDEMSLIGLIKSVQIHFVLSNKYTVHVHFHYWYNCPIAKTIDYHFNQNKVVCHEGFTHDLRKLYSNEHDENVQLRKENEYIRNECMSVISHIGLIHDNIEDVKQSILCRKKVRFESAAEAQRKDAYRIYPKDCPPYFRKKVKCPGCLENQPNQMAHIGPNGCLGDEY